MNPFIRLHSNYQLVPDSISSENISKNILVLDPHLKYRRYHKLTVIVFPLTSTFLSFKAFPHLTKKGTPSHLSLLILSKAAANVGQVEPAGTLTQDKKILKWLKR